MFSDLNARLLFEVARTNIDRVPLSGETTERDEDVLESPSRTVPDEALLRYIDGAQRECAEEVKAMYLPSLVTTYTGSLSSLDQTKLARILPARVERDDNETWQTCTRRSVAEHNYLEASGRKATPARPTFTFGGGTLDVYPGDDPEIRVDYVGYPDPITMSDVSSDPWHVGGADSLDVESVLGGAIAMYVTAKAQRSLDRYGMHSLYMSLYERLRRPFLRTMRIGREEEYGRSRVDEPEVNTEV